MKQQMKIKSIISIITFVIFSFLASGQTPEYIKKEKYKRVSEAYGYLIGQEYFFKIIKVEFPSLELNIIRAQLLFNSTFGKSKENLRIYLSEFLGENEFKDYEIELIAELKKMVARQMVTEEDALDFITEVGTRANGQIASPVLETLLSFQFVDRPQDEFLLGFNKIYRTKGHPKSKNTDWQIRVPKSWRAEEADRPNIIQQFTSDFGDGHQCIMLMVKEMELSKGYKWSKEDLNELFTEKEMKGFVPNGGKFISFKKMTLDNNLGGMLEFEQIVERLDIKVKMCLVAFIFIRDNKMYFLQGGISNKLNSDLTKEMQKYLPLFKLVANTIVVNDQYNWK
jgi:hypothetical protein